jgi:hypothetical protein
MRLILGCCNDDDSVMVKDQILLIVNTDNKELEWIPLNIAETGDIIGARGMCMSGDYLMVSLKTNSKNDKFVIIDVVTKRNQLTNCTKSKDVHGMVSVFRGRIYCMSTGTDSMNNIVLSPSTNNIMRDVKHYSLDNGGDDYFHATSLFNWDRRWFTSLYGLGWKDGDFSNGCIIELSKNNRIVYSNINQPNSLFFNRNNEMCFLESGRSLFHCGRNIYPLGSGYPMGVIEDRENNGYWIGVSGERITSRLKFFSYDGEYLDSITLPWGVKVYSIIGSEGYLSKLL